MLPARFLDLVKQLEASCSDLLNCLRKRAGVRADSRAFEVVIWSKLLDIPPSFAIEAFNLPKVSNAAISKAEERVGTIPEEELVEAKCECWAKWGEIVAAKVTTLREIIRPIFAYAETCRDNRFQRGRREKYGQPQIEMINAFLEIRHVGIREGLEVLNEQVAGIPIYLLFWLPAIPSKRTFFQAIG